MKFWLILVLIVSAWSVLPGCGGTSMDDMKRNAIRRKKDTDEPAPAAVAATPPSLPNAPALPTSGATPGGTNAPAPTVHRPTASAPQSAAALPPAAPTSAPRAAARVSKPEEKPVLPLSVVERRAKTIQHLAALGTALQSYITENGSLPAPVVSGPGGAPLLSWRVELLPYLGYHELYQKFHLDEPWDSQHNKPLIALIPPEFQSPERFDERTNYVVPVGTDAAYFGTRGSPKRRFADGLPNTVILLEVDDNRAVPWTQPSEYAYQSGSPDADTGILREDGFFVVWGDGQVGRIPRGSHPDGLRAMFTVDGGEDFARAEFQQPATPEVGAAGAPVVARRTRPAETIDLDDAGDLGGAPRVAAKPATRPAPMPRPREEDNDPGLGAYEPPVSDELPTGDLADLAAIALAEGRERDAFQLFYAAALTSPPEDAWHESMRWIPALQRPVMAVRWGFGVQYSGAASATLAPIGRTSAVSVGEHGTGLARLVGYGGELGEKMLDEMKFRLESGRWGAVYALGENAPRVTRREVVNPDVPASRQVHNVMSGISYFGKGTRKELVHAANQEGVDLLLIFEIVSKPNRANLPLNTTSLTVVDAQRNKTLYDSPALSNIKVLKQREDRLQQDPIKAWVDKFLAFVDENVRSEDLPPSLKPEHAVSRVTALSAAKCDNPLPNLVEIRLYHDRQLIDDDQLRAAYQSLLGERSAGLLIDGDEEERHAVLEKWLPRAPRGKAGAALSRVSDD